MCAARRAACAAWTLRPSPSAPARPGPAPACARPRPAGRRRLEEDWKGRAQQVPTPLAAGVIRSLFRALWTLTRLPHALDTGHPVAMDSDCPDL
ncbi:unnamed protein product [Rangifer tarandus platyrhynchus]|uniref:Uncharacterized protein n=1 Tax=Rangifer tarandus platyrhynchus TaxID=3082113 RepID=A0AC59Y8V8_RANTA